MELVQSNLVNRKLSATSKMKFNTKNLCFSLFIAGCAVEAASVTPNSSNSTEVCPENAVSTDIRNGAMFEAFNRGDYWSAFKLVSLGADLNACGLQTPLELVAGKCDRIGVTLMVKHGAKANIIGHGRNSALHQAVDCGNLDLVNYLLLVPGCRVNFRNSAGMTPLMTAVNRPNANFEIIKALVEAGGAIKAVDANGENSVFLAARNMNFEILKYLIEKGGVNLIEFKNKDGDRFYEIFKGNDHPEVASKLKVYAETWATELFEKDIEGLPQDCLKLIAAVLRKDYVKAKRKIPKCGNNVSRAAGVTFRKSGNMDTLKYFQYATNNLNIYEVPFYEQPESDKKLFGEINQRDKKGVSDLMVKSRDADDPAVVRSLLDSGARLQFVDTNGENALFYAYRGGKEGNLELLLSNDEGKSMVHDVNFEGESISDIKGFKLSDSIKALLKKTQNEVPKPLTGSVPLDFTGTSGSNTGASTDNPTKSPSRSIFGLFRK